ncbi:MAG: TonB-dependent receptor [Tannerella sp.]|nr:TonB-dependent receptor [Tannerella sp.]
MQRAFWLVCMFTCFSLTMVAQSVGIKGKVVDAIGEPVIGANVVEKGTSNGVITDVDGYFSLNVSSGAKLLISYIGYATQEVAIGNRTDITVTLLEDTKALEEVVVVGYGIQKKVNLTGAVSQITSKEFENRPVATVAQMMQGTMPNVKITVSSGAPGQGASVQVRGTGSLNGSDPLVLVDGVPGSLNRLNPSDIESVSVLKDAASAAIYGARGAFGVVLVTTKSAKSGQTRVSYDMYGAWSTPTARTDYITEGYEATRLIDIAFKAYSGRIYSGYTDEDIQELMARRNDKTEDPSRPWVVIKPYAGRDIYNYYGNFDWWNFLFNKWRPSQYHNVNISGGNDKVSYMVSASATLQDGLMKHNTDEFTALTINSKISAQLASWLKLTNNTVYYDSKYTYPGLEGGANQNFANDGAHLLPMYVPYNPDGTFTYSTGKNSYGIGDGHIPAYLGDVSKGKNGVHELKETVSFEASILENLKFIADYSFQMTIYDNWYRRGISEYSLYPGVISTIPAYSTDYYNKTMNYNATHVANGYFAYNQTFSDHTVGATAGVNYETTDYRDLKGQRYDLITTTLNDLNLGTGESLANGGQNKYRLFGLFYRLNYDYKSRYLFEFNGRYDGTSRFMSGKRFGFFPSVSAGWRLSEEEWFAPLRSGIDNLKIRLSYGSLGNQVSGSNYYPYISSMTATLSSWLIDGQKPYQVGIPAPVADNLTWEKSTTSNAGIDISLLQNRLSFTGDFYIRNTTGMLVNGLTVPSVFGASSPQQNAGDMRTKGYELTLGWNDEVTIAGKPLRYSINATLGDAMSEITKYDANEKGLISDYYVGKKIGEIWGYTSVGLFQSDEEAVEWNKTVDQKYVNSLSYSGEWNNPKAGDVKFLDLDNNGKIHPGASTLDDPGDRKVIGNSTPRYNYGVNMSASWNGIDFSAFFQGIGHQDMYPGGKLTQFWGTYGRPAASFLPKNFADDAWREDNKDAYFPQIERGYAAYSANRQLYEAQTRYLQNIAYLRLKNLVLGYTLPALLTKKIYIERLRVYASGENLFFISPMHTEYYDPEELSANWEGKVYPLAKVFSVGLNVTF